MRKGEKGKLIEFRNYLMDRTDFFSERSKIPSPKTSSQGRAMDKGVANGYIGARAKLEELFDYLNLWE